MCTLTHAFVLRKQESALQRAEASGKPYMVAALRAAGAHEEEPDKGEDLGLEQDDESEEEPEEDEDEDLDDEQGESDESSEDD